MLTAKFYLITFKYFFMLQFKKDIPKTVGFVTARKKPVLIKCAQIHEPFEVETLEGTMRGQAGDWLMIGVKGEMYPCSNEIFRATYDIVTTHGDN